MSSQKSSRANLGREILRDTVGADYFETRTASTNWFNQPLRNLTDEYCFGEVWGGEDLSRKTRSMLVMAMLATMGRGHELRTHVGGALNNGCTPEEIRGVLLQVAIYAGIPAGVESTRIAETVLRERGLVE